MQNVTTKQKYRFKTTFETFKQAKVENKQKDK